MRFGACALVALAMLLAGASDGITATTTPTPNVRGVVLYGATPPGCYPGEPCDPPVKPAFLMFRRAGHLPARARLGVKGGFALHLSPGRYVLVLTPAVAVTRLVPATVLVPAKGSVKVTVHLIRMQVPPAPDS